MPNSTTTAPETHACVSLEPEETGPHLAFNTVALAYFN